MGPHASAAHPSPPRAHTHTYTLTHTPDAVCRTEVDLGLSIGTPHHYLFQLRVPKTPHHTLEVRGGGSHEPCPNACDASHVPYTNACDTSYGKKKLLQYNHCPAGPNLISWDTPLPKTQVLTQKQQCSANAYRITDSKLMYFGQLLVVEHQLPFVLSGQAKSCLTMHDSSS